MGRRCSREDALPKWKAEVILVAGEDREDDTQDSLERHKAIRTAEKRRVKSLIEDHKRSIAMEANRQSAEIEVRDGVFVNLDDTVMGPTPEWLLNVPSQSFIPRQPDGTVRKVSTVRSVQTPIIIRMLRSGKISDEHAYACIWYREVHAKAGLEGRYSTNQFGPQIGFGASSAKRVGGAGGHIPMTEDEAYAREMYRAARNSISSHNIKYFESVVIQDIPLHRASRFARCRYGRFIDTFRKSVIQLAAFCEAQKVDMRGIGR